MASPATTLPALQAEAARLPSWFPGGVALRRAGEFQATGVATTDAEALAAALASYRELRAGRERRLAATRRAGRIACPECFGLHPNDAGCRACDRGVLEEASCRECDTPLAADEIGCTCGEADSWLCQRCAVQAGVHLAGCPAVDAAARAPGTCAWGSPSRASSRRERGWCGEPVVAGTPWCPEHLAGDPLHALADGVEIG